MSSTFMEIATPVQAPGIDSPQATTQATEIVAQEGADHLALRAAGLAGTAALAACGGGSDGGAAPSSASVTTTATPADTSSPILSEVEASRFLSYATLGATSSDIATLIKIAAGMDIAKDESSVSVKKRTIEKWLDWQMGSRIIESVNLRYDTEKSHVNWLKNKYVYPPNTPAPAGKPDNPLNPLESNNRDVVDTMIGHVWNNLIHSNQALRQRVSLALSEIVVVSIDALQLWYKVFSASRYIDILEENAFGSYEKLLFDVSLSPAMAEYLTYLGNKKYNPTTGALPDENYAREILQLFPLVW